MAGMIQPHAGAAAPAGFLFCDGSAVSRATYAALFVAIGTTYGVGDGSTTFNVPDMRGRAVFGKDDMGGTAANRLTSGGGGIAGATLGAVGGGETVTLDINKIPSHGHNYRDVGTSGSTPAPTGGATNFGYLATSSAGGGGAHQNVPPAMVVNYIIKT